MHAKTRSILLWMIFLGANFALFATKNAPLKFDDVLAGFVTGSAVGYFLALFLSKP